MGFRDTKAKARRDLHTKMRVAALYTSPQGSAPLEMNVRVHTQWAALGEVKGTSFDYAEREDTVPEIIIDRLELDDLDRGGVVAISAEEMYRVDHSEPPDGEFRTVKVNRMLPAERVGVAFPEPIAPSP